MFVEDRSSNLTAIDELYAVVPLAASRLAYGSIF